MVSFKSARDLRHSANRCKAYLVVGDDDLGINLLQDVRDAPFGNQESGSDSHATVDAVYPVE